MLIWVQVYNILPESEQSLCDICSYSFISVGRDVGVYLVLLPALSRCGINLVHSETSIISGWEGCVHVKHGVNNLLIGLALMAYGK